MNRMDQQKSTCPICGRDLGTGPAVTITSPGRGVVCYHCWMNASKEELDKACGVKARKARKASHDE